MTIATISIVRHCTIHATSVPILDKVLRRISTIRCFSISAAKQYQNSNSVSKRLHQPNKKLLKAKQTFKDHSSLVPVFLPHDNLPLSETQAICTVAAAQANFMCVIVQSSREPSGSPDDDSDDSSRIGVELLCVVRAMLKKIRRRVLVGDKVLVRSTDWVDRRGMIENVFQRSSVILAPPVANVDHLLVFFSMDLSRIEPFALTRLLVEAESTGILLTTETEYSLIQ